jgi:hypothetical protein
LFQKLSRLGISNLNGLSDYILAGFMWEFPDYRFWEVACAVLRNLNCYTTCLSLLVYLRLLSLLGPLLNMSK